MQIDHITFSKTGGAGIVAQTIAASQRELGHDVNVLTLVDSDLRSEPLRKPLLTLAAALDEWVLSSGMKNTLFSPLRGGLGRLNAGSVRPEAIIHLHWMPGVLAPENVRALLDAGRKVVWTLHDMNPFTGGCHYSHECIGFTRSCQNCPQVRPIFQETVSINLSKKVLPRHYPNLRIVSPTDWMAEQGRLSSAFRGQESIVVRNPVDRIFFSRPSHQTQPRNLKDPISKFLAVAIAKDLREPRKNIEFVVRSLEEASRISGADISLFLIGQNGSTFSSSTVRLVWLGELTAAEIVQQVTAADLLLSGSLAESAGMTVVECAAMGIPSLALENGGTASQIRNGVSGILAQDFDSFTAGVVDLISKPIHLSSLGAAARETAELHRPAIVARRYLDVYESMA